MTQREPPLPPPPNTTPPPPYCPLPICNTSSPHRYLFPPPYSPDPRRPSPSHLNTGRCLRCTPPRSLRNPIVLAQAAQAAHPVHPATAAMHSSRSTPTPLSKPPTPPALTPTPLKSARRPSASLTRSDLPLPSNPTPPCCCPHRPTPPSQTGTLRWLPLNRNDTTPTPRSPPRLPKPHSRRKRPPPRRVARERDAMATACTAHLTLSWPWPNLARPRRARRTHSTSNATTSAASHLSPPPAIPATTRLPTPSSCRHPPATPSATAPPAYINQPLPCPAHPRPHPSCPRPSLHPLSETPRLLL